MAKVITFPELLALVLAKTKEEQEKWETELGKLDPEGRAWRMECAKMRGPSYWAQVETLALYLQEPKHMAFFIGIHEEARDYVMDILRSFESSPSFRYADGKPDLICKLLEFTEQWCWRKSTVGGFGRKEVVVSIRMIDSMVAGVMQRLSDVSVDDLERLISALRVTLEKKATLDTMDKELRWGTKYCGKYSKFAEPEEMGFNKLVADVADPLARPHVPDLKIADYAAYVRFEQALGWYKKHARYLVDKGTLDEQADKLASCVMHPCGGPVQKEIALLCAILDLEDAHDVVDDPVLRERCVSYLERPSNEPKLLEELQMCLAERKGKPKAEPKEQEP